MIVTVQILSGGDSLSLGESGIFPMYGLFSLCLRNLFPFIMVV